MNLLNELWWAKKYQHQQNIKRTNERPIISWIRENWNYSDAIFFGYRQSLIAQMKFKQQSSTLFVLMKFLNNYEQKNKPILTLKSWNISFSN